eukprot:gb/GECG01000724.1/.p1 GENE.gb/GECG01000724.1/~~gb/GECG01000724.1/.p1  ORF type:complete len:808 (+),score=147.02 gb/GECG01000724.1/:1-2424(+)
MASSQTNTDGSAADHSASLLEKLPQLQNLIKRDPDAYTEEFELQYQNYRAELEIFKLHPSKDSQSFKDLVNFLSHVTPCYPERLRDFPKELMDLIEEHGSILEGDTRKTIVQCLMIMRNRGFIEPIPLLKLFFKLFRIQDKLLRELVYSHIVSDVKNMNYSTGTRRAQKNKKAKGFGNSKTASVLIPQGQTVDHVNRQLQSYMYTMITDENVTAARRSLDVLIEVYRRKIWTDSRTVNAVAKACLSSYTRLVVPAIKFFLGVYDSSDEGEESDEEDEDKRKSDASNPKNMTKKELQKMQTHSKRTRKRKRQAQRIIEKMRQRGTDKKVTVAAFPAIQLIHDPQTLAEKMLNEVRKSVHKFEVRLLQLNLVSLLVGQHRLIVLNLYSFLQRYLTAHQEHVTEVMAYLVQGCHDLVPPSELIPIIRSIADNFVSDRCPDEVIQVGINVIRAVMTKTPSILEEDYIEDLVRDLVGYKRHKTSKGVVMAARSLLNFVRENHPTLLHRKDRGRDHDPSARPISYGAGAVAGGIAGTEVLAEGDESSEDEMDEENEGTGSERGDDSEEEDSEDDDSEGENVADDSVSDAEQQETGESEADEAGVINSEDTNSVSKSSRDNRKRSRVEANQLLTDEDFSTLQKARESATAAEKPKKKSKRRKVSTSREQSLAKASTLSAAGKPLADEAATTEQEDEDSDSDAERKVPGATFSNPIEVVDPDSLEAESLLKRRAAKANAAEREKEKQQKWKPKERKGGLTNRENSRMKNYMMIRKSQSVQSKLKTSLAKQQKAIRKHLKTQSKLGKHEKKKRRRI